MGDIILLFVLIFICVLLICFYIKKLVFASHDLYNLIFNRKNLKIHNEYVVFNKYTKKLENDNSYIL